MKPMVTVLTTAYNHAPYIAQTIEGFLMQKTNFPIEMIIHDDASTDGTTDIIRDYVKRYPDKIKAIFQKENQYSKGINVYDFMTPYIRGKYLAECEGDDYWCDENKLQIQVNWMENHSEYSACVHNTKKIDLKNNTETIWFPIDGDKDLVFEQILKGGNSCFHVSSVLWRADIQFPEEMSEIKSFGDYVLAVCLGIQGKIRYFDTVMSVYRYFTPGSWSMRQSVSSEQRIQRYQDNLKLLQNIDRLTNYKYSHVTEEIIKKQKFCICEESGLYQELKRGELKSLYQQLPLWRHLNITVKQYMPGLFRVYKNITKKWSGKKQ